MIAEALKHKPCPLQKGEDKQLRHSSETRNNSNCSRTLGFCRVWARHEAWLCSNPTVSAPATSLVARPKNSGKQQLACHDSSMPTQVPETD